MYQKSTPWYWPLVFGCRSTYSRPGITNPGCIAGSASFLPNNSQQTCLPAGQWRWVLFQTEGTFEVLIVVCTYLQLSQRVEALRPSQKVGHWILYRGFTTATYCSRYVGRAAPPFTIQTLTVAQTGMANSMLLPSTVWSLPEILPESFSRVVLTMEAAK